MLQTVRVASKVWPDARAENLLNEIRRSLGITTIKKIRVVKVYRFEGVDLGQAGLMAIGALNEPLMQECVINGPLIVGAARTVEVAYKPGVMNPEAASLLKCAADLELPVIAADSGWEYGFYGALSDEDLHAIVTRLLCNPTVGMVVTETPKTLLVRGDAGSVLRRAIRELDDEGLSALSKGGLYLDSAEMRAVQAYFCERAREPTDVELETVAQTWSEHCKHKTFRAAIDAVAHGGDPLIERLKKIAGRYPELTVSSFHDNSGVMVLYDGWAICIKLETHNSPSASEPYGGAATGTGGVIRDIMGTGKGAKVIASIDIFCVAPPDLAKEKLPPGCQHPDYLLRQVVAGVRDYGNRMGIPTVNGSVHFHEDFRAKPAVIVGAIGLIPVALADKGQAQTGDKVMAIGGCTGRDGIHGATFSSVAMNERTSTVHATAVQIGNAIEEKRLADALLACRDAGLIRAITDCGAGGFSSAVGEMGEKTGVRVELDRAPLKYQGLAPWEIWVSESQERMVAAVAPENVERFLAICRGYNVEATDIGEFTADRRLTVTYAGETVCDLEMAFLHDGCPPRVLKSSYECPAHRPEPDVPPPANRAAWEDLYLRVMAHGNVCSKEPIVRMYDHSVQGATALPPYLGVRNDAPTDAAVLRPIPGKPFGVVFSHGLNPDLIRRDPHWGSRWAIAECVANLAAVGGNIREASLIDNFIWPVPDDRGLYALAVATDACVEAMHTFRIPFISGKDSLSGTYRGPDGAMIEMPYTLCVSAVGRIPDAAKTVSSDFKRAGSKIVLLGYMDAFRLGGSAYYDVLGVKDGGVPQVFLHGMSRFLDELYFRIGRGHILACHDISEGGIAAALAEMCMGGGFGARVDLKTLGPEGRADMHFFNETAGCFLLEVRQKDIDEDFFLGRPCRVIGETIAEPLIWVQEGTSTLCLLPVDELRAAYQRPMKELFP